jgi:hypothetical protein
MVLVNLSESVPAAAFILPEGCERVAIEPFPTDAQA